MRSKAVPLALLAAALLSIAALPSLAAPRPAYRYLGLLAPGYPPEIAARELRNAGAEVAGIRDGLVLFSLGDRAQAAGYLRDLPCVTRLFTDPASLRAAGLPESTLVRAFRDGGLPTPGRVAGGLPATVSGAAGPAIPLSSSMRARRTWEILDAAYRRRGDLVPPSGPRALADDDASEENDSYTDATVVSAGTTSPAVYGGLVLLDEDWYKVTVPAGSDLVVWAEHASGSVQMSLGRVPPGGSLQELAWSFRQSATVQKVFLADVATAGEYFVRVTAGSWGTTYSLNLQAGNLLGSIAGRITSASTGAGLDGAYAAAYTTDGYYVRSAPAAAGNYSVPVPEGSYKVNFSDRLHDYLDEWYDGSRSISGARTLLVSENAATPGIDADLVQGGRITGRVTASATGAGVYDVCLQVVDAAGDGVTYGYSDTDGTYVCNSVPAGNVRIAAYPPGEGLAYSWYNGRTRFEDADPVAVAAGGVRSGVNFALAPGASVAGTVTSADAPDGLEGVAAILYDAARRDIVYAVTNADGTYRLTNLPPGSYRLFFVPAPDSAYARQWYAGRPSFEEATPIALAAGQARAGVDATMILGGRVSGTVTGPFGDPVNYVGVIAYDLAGMARSYTYSQSDGTWTIPGLTPGLYKIFFNAESSAYASEWWSGRGAFEAADPVAVVSGGDVTSVDADLEAGGMIYAYVMNSEYVNVNRVLVKVYDLAQRLVAADYTSYGNAQFAGLAAGSYKVYFDASFASPKFYSEWYQDKPSFSTATAVVVRVNQSTTVAGILDGPPALAVAAPLAGTAWYTGKTKTIGWVRSGAQASTVRIQLLSGGALLSTLAASTPNDREFAWTIPTTLPAGSAYRVRVATTDGRLTATSGAFTLLKPSIAVTAPAAGAVWGRGAGRTIAWTSTGTSARVTIKLMRGTSVVAVLATGVANTGSWPWAIPMTAPVGTGFWIRVSTLDNAAIGKSGLFSIAAVD